MKNLKSLKLNQLSKTEMDKKELNKLRGGGCCICGCEYNSTVDNGGGNNVGSQWSPGGGWGNGSYSA